MDSVYTGRPREECGVFAIYNYRGPDTAAHIAYLGLLALQHRGQESAGMAFNGPDGMTCYKGLGLVSRLFPRETLAGITAPTVLGHVRYSTTGEGSIHNAQPMVARSVNREAIALAHNGNLSNNALLRRSMLEGGTSFTPHPIRKQSSPFCSNTAAWGLCRRRGKPWAGSGARTPPWPWTAR